MFVQDILQRHSNKKADFRRKMTLLLPKNGTIGRERERTLPLGSEVGFFLGQLPRALKNVYIGNFVFIFFAFDIHCYTFVIKSITVWK